GLRFRHPGASRDALSIASVEIAAGTQLGVVGPSGAGKTTLVLLVLGFLEPTDGIVRIDVVAAREHFVKGRVRVGYVGVEFYLVAGTIRENLGYGLHAPPSDEAIWTALAAVKLDALVRARPGGLGLALDESGSGLSAGE